MNKIDLIVDALENAVHNFAGDDTEEKCIAALAAARELRELKPVAWAVLRPDGRVKLLSHQQGVEVDLKWTPLYVAPTKREWVNLTDEDIGDAYVAWDNTDGASFADFARLIEAQLRKKNG